MRGLDRFDANPSSLRVDLTRSDSPACDVDQLQRSRGVARQGETQCEWSTVPWVRVHSTQHEGRELVCSDIHDAAAQLAACLNTLSVDICECTSGRPVVSPSQNGPSAPVGQGGG